MSNELQWLDFNMKSLKLFVDSMIDKGTLGQDIRSLGAHNPSLSRKLQFKTHEIRKREAQDYQKRLDDMSDRINFENKRIAQMGDKIDPAYKSAWERKVAEVKAYVSSLGKTLNIREETVARSIPVPMQTPIVPPPVPKKPVTVEKKTPDTNWYYFNANGDKVGPLTAVALKALANHGLIDKQTVIENGGRTTLAEKVKGLVPSCSTATTPTEPISINPPVSMEPELITPQIENIVETNEDVLETVKQSTIPASPVASKPIEKKRNPSKPVRMPFEKPAMVPAWPFFVVAGIAAIAGVIIYYQPPIVDSGVNWLIMIVLLALAACLTGMGINYWVHPKKLAEDKFCQVVGFLFLPVVLALLILGFLFLLVPFMCGSSSSDKNKK